MAKSKHQREVLEQAAEDGDALASMALADLAMEEDGLPSFWRPQRGDLVVIFTAMYFHKGRLLGEDHEYYCLEAGSEEVYETGPLEEFYKGNIKLAERIPEVANVRKGSTVKIVRWTEEAEKRRQSQAKS